MKKLSIITVNLNNAEGLLKTLQSVASQTFTDYEHIIIDGCSNDGSVEIIKQYINKITYWISEPDKGIYNAMNKGVLQARGEYLLFLNSADWLVNEKILSEIFDEPRTSDIVYGNLNQVLHNGNIKVQESLHGDKLTLANFNTNSHATIQHPAAFIKKSLFDKGLYDENYRIIADIKFFIERMIFQNCTVEFLPYCITNFNMDGISSNPANWTATINERELMFKELLPARIYKDYELFFQIKDAAMLRYIPFLEKTNTLNKFATQFVASVISFYKFLKSKS